MKEYIQTMLVFTVMLLVIPCLVFALPERHVKETKAAAEQISYSGGLKNVKIYFRKENKIREYTAREYAVGAVLAQMPANFEPEALKAQAVLAQTYIVCRSMEEGSAPTPSLHGCLISDDTELYQGFFTKSQAKDFYKEDYEEAYKKVSDAVKSVEDKIVVYKGQPVLAAFHGVSSGYTESAENAWGINYPYLQSVESKWDLKVDNMQTSQTVTAEEAANKLTKLLPDEDFSNLNTAEDWIKVDNKTSRGYVTRITVKGNDVDVSSFISAMDIASPCFEMDFKNTKFEFTAKGYGHLVGMSQYGANAMAENGKNYKDILMYYYKNCKIKDAD